jgi:hypothetical protein
MNLKAKVRCGDKSKPQNPIFKPKKVKKQPNFCIFGWYTAKIEKQQNLKAKSKAKILDFLKKCKVYHFEASKSPNSEKAPNLRNLKAESKGRRQIWTPKNPHFGPQKVEKSRF